MDCLEKFGVQRLGTTSRVLDDLGIYEGVNALDVAQSLDPTAKEAYHDKYPNADSYITSSGEYLILDEL